MTMNRTIRTARHQQPSAATTMWQPCVGVDTGSFNCLSSLSLYTVTGSNRLPEQTGTIEGLTIKDRHNIRI
ncbi:MAG: hypothetical protein H0U54_19290 [Acidobacteria bacterium]|nr:hypothetical protein [Acidobacteriota bacterium]